MNKNIKNKAEITIMELSHENRELKNELEHTKAQLRVVLNINDKLKAENYYQTEEIKGYESYIKELRDFIWEHNSTEWIQHVEEGEITCL